MPKLNEISGEIKALEAKIESVDNKADIRTAPVLLLAQVFFFPKRKSVGLNLWRHYGVGKVEFGKPSFN